MKSNMQSVPSRLHVTMPAKQTPGITLVSTDYEHYNYFARVAKYCDECMSVCLSVREDISGTTRAIFTTFLCMLPVFVARSSSGMLTIGRIAYRR